MKKDFKSFVVGIAGGSGAGKTFLIKTLAQALGEENICVFSQDNYYLPQEQQPQDEQGIANFDTLQSLDWQQYRQDLQDLRTGKQVQKAEYTFNNPANTSKMLTFNPAPLLLVEGVFVFHPKDLFESFDLKIFVEVPDSLRLKRRILRDNQERGYDLHDVLYRYEKHVIPAYREHIAPFKEQVDMILPNLSNFEVVLEVLISFFRAKLAELNSLQNYE